MGKIDIERVLTGGNPRKLLNDDVIELVLARPDRVGDLFECMFSDDEIVRMRASDALEKVCSQRSDLLQPFIERLLTEVPEVRQLSVQWHLAEILGEVTLDNDERRQAVEILRRNLDEMDDWIVVNLTIQTLAEFASKDPDLQPDLVSRLHGYAGSEKKSVARRARKLLNQFEG